MDQLSEARRTAIARLCQAQAAGHLSVHTFEQRYALIREAESRSTIDAIVADLVEDEVPGTGSHLPAELPDLGQTPLPEPAASSVRLPAIFSTAKRKGRWAVPEHIALLVILGEVELDFRDAIFASDTVEIDVSVTLGSLKLIVPPGTQVENECHETLSSSSVGSKWRRRSSPNGLLIVISGRLLLGDLSVKEKPPAGTGPTLMERLGLKGGP